MVTGMLGALLIVWLVTVAQNARTEAFQARKAAEKWDRK